MAGSLDPTVASERVSPPAPAKQVTCAAGRLSVC